MLPDILLPEQIVCQDGESPSFPLEGAEDSAVGITLLITRTTERESLELSILGSPDGTNWGPKPLLHFTPKFYCGTYRQRLDLAGLSSVRNLKLKWTLNRWGHGASVPLFGLCVRACCTVPAAQSAGA